MCTTKQYCVTLFNVHVEAYKKILTPEQKYNIFNQNYNLIWSLYWSTQQHIWQNFHDLNKNKKNQITRIRVTCNDNRIRVK
jgi:hypothetical protein